MKPGDRIQFRFRLYFYDWMWWYIDDWALDGAVPSGYTALWEDDLDAYKGDSEINNGYPDKYKITHDGDGEMTLSTDRYLTSPNSLKTYYDGGDDNRYTDYISPEFKMSDFEIEYDGSLSIHWGYWLDWYDSNDDEFCMEFSVNGGSFDEYWCDGDEQTDWSEVEWTSDNYTNYNDIVQIRFKNSYKDGVICTLDNILVNGVVLAGVEELLSLCI